VRAASGAVVRVAEVVVWPKAHREIVELGVDSMRLLVTASHRVAVPAQQGEVDMQAGFLQLGQTVCCSHGTGVLSHVQKSVQEVEIYEIVFDPDVSVEAWSPPTGTICTKGRKPKVLLWSPNAISKVVLLRFSRHPAAFANALAQHPILRAVRQALEHGGHDSILRGGAKVFVLPAEYASAMAALRQHKVGPHHVIVSEQFLLNVKEVSKSLPHKESMKIKHEETLAHFLRDGPDSATVSTRSTFLEARVTDNIRDTKSVANSTTVAHGGQNPRCLV